MISRGALITTFALPRFVSRIMTSMSSPMKTDSPSLHVNTSMLLTSVSGFCAALQHTRRKSGRKDEIRR